MLHIIPNYKEAEFWCDKAKELDAAFEYNEFFSPSIIRDPDKIKEISEVYKSLDRDRSKDTLHGPFFDIVVDSCDPDIKELCRKRIYQGIAAAKELGCRAIIFHTNYITGFKAAKYRKGWIDENENFYRSILRENTELDIYIENMFDENSVMLTALAERLSNEPNFGVCLDIAHAYLSEESIESWIDNLAPFIKHLHLNDNFKDEDSHLAVGDGSLPWQILKSEKLYLNNPSILIEVKDKDKLQKSYDYLKNGGYI